jgi:hypothetical protein
MKALRYTLVADGSSDRTLIPILDWVFDRYHPDISYRPQFAERLPAIGLELAQRASMAIKLYPCDLLFVHRDAERDSFDTRIAEIRNKLKDIGSPLVPIVPVRMTEAWLLSDENAIRRAAGNPNGHAPLSLPSARHWDQEADPKAILFGALKSASELPGRKLKKFSEGMARHRVAELTEDFSPLERLPAFAALRDEISQAVRQFATSQA